MNRSTSSFRWSTISTSKALALAIATCGICTAGIARAQSIIKQPGNHPAYGVDLEPHVVFGWDDNYYGGSAFGLGMRATIPFLRNGPVSTINNDMGIGFGLDWVTRGSCNRAYYYAPGNNYYFDCSAYAIYLPIVLQWNFYITDIITVYGEPGFAIRYAHVGWTLADQNNVPRDYSNGYTDPILVMSGGAKFMFGKTVGLNVRVGYPYFTVGASFLL